MRPSCVCVTGRVGCVAQEQVGLQHPALTAPHRGRRDGRRPPRACCAPAIPSPSARLTPKRHGFPRVLLGRLVTSRTPSSLHRMASGPPAAWGQRRRTNYRAGTVFALGSVRLFPAGTSHGEQAFSPLIKVRLKSSVSGACIQTRGQRKPVLRANGPDFGLF